MFSSHQLDLVERLCDRVGIIRDGAMVASGTWKAAQTEQRQRLIVAGRPRRAAGPTRCPGCGGRTENGQQTWSSLGDGARLDQSGPARPAREGRSGSSPRAAVARRAYRDVVSSEPKLEV